MSTKHYYWSTSSKKILAEVDQKNCIIWQSIKKTLADISQKIVTTDGSLKSSLVNVGKKVALVDVDQKFIVDANKR